MSREGSKSQRTARGRLAPPAKNGENVWRHRSGRPFATIPFFRRDNAHHDGHHHHHHHQRGRGVSDGVVLCSVGSKSGSSANCLIIPLSLVSHCLSLCLSVHPSYPS